MQSLNGKTTGSSLTAAEWNQLPTEVQNVITTAGLTLSAGDLTQLVKSVATYAAAGTFYTDSGAADAYVLSSVDSLTAPPALKRGMEVRFLAANTNTGASTVNVAGLGVVSIVDLAGAAMQAGQIVANQLITLFYDGTTNFVFIPNTAGGFDINGLTPALPTLGDTSAFYDTSAATNRKADIFTLGNRTWDHVNLTGNVTINTDAGYLKSYVRVDNTLTNFTITVNDSTTAELVGTSFVVSHNVSDGSTGSVFVNRQTTGVFAEGFQTGLTQVVVRPGESKLFYRNANNSYVVFTLPTHININKRFWVPNLAGIGTSSFGTQNNYEDYRRMWENVTGGGALTYTAVSPQDLTGTSFILANRTGSGDLTFDMSAMANTQPIISGTTLTIKPHESYLFLCYGIDSYYIMPLFERPFTVSNYNYSGRKMYMRTEGADAVNFFDVPGNLAHLTYETVGPTGSGAANIWTGMNGLPADARAVICTVFLRADVDTGGSTTGLHLYGRHPSGSSSITGGQRVFGIEWNDGTMAASAWHSKYGEVILPLNTSLQTEIAYNAINCSPATLNLFCKGFLNETELEAIMGL